MQLSQLFVANLVTEGKSSPPTKLGTPAAAPDVALHVEARPEDGGSGETKAPAPAAAAGAQPTAVFLTPQSLTTFPVASTIVFIIQGFMPGVLWLKVAAIVFVGAAVFVASVMDEKARPKGGWGWIGAIMIGILNTAMLGAAASGIKHAPAALGLQ